MRYLLAQSIYRTAIGIKSVEHPLKENSSFISRSVKPMMGWHTSTSSAQHVHPRWRCLASTTIKPPPGLACIMSVVRDGHHISRVRTSGIVHVASPAASPSFSASNEDGVTEASMSAAAPAPEQLQVPHRALPLVLEGGAFMLPHPAKMAKGGEDGYFIAANRRAMGIADGVGGWADVGVDAGLYARLLMSHACDAAMKATASSSSSSAVNGSSTHGGGTGSPPAAEQCKLSAQQILEVAHASTDVKGSSTACIMVLNDRSLLGSNLGDSGFLVIRQGQLLMATSQQQHSFNFPFQIGGEGAMGDHPRQAARYKVELQPGDVIVAGTDGLWDNCFHNEILAVIRHCVDSGIPADKTAQMMAHYARHRAADTKFASPFAYAAYQANIRFLGGKMDDITVIVAFVEEQQPPITSKL